jgi:hypothetical protein
MIVANLATYPPRAEFLPRVVASIAPQVDRLNVVLNEYDTVPTSLAGIANVHAILPDEDTKDAGKFYPDISGADHVLLIDDDIVYPDDYVVRILAAFRSLAVPRALGGYHCSVYVRPALSLTPSGLRQFLRFHLRPSRIAGYRRILHFGLDVPEPLLVDQVATNAAILRADDMPPWDYMRTSRKFVDVRLARWCFEQGIVPVLLPHAADWLLPSYAVGVDFEETIVGDFTSRHPPHVAREIWRYAFKRPKVGSPVPVAGEGAGRTARAV